MRDLKALIKEMTLEEKASLCSGQDFWHTKAVERLGIPQTMVCDGPYGLRKQDQSQDNLGINDAIVAVCFPAASTTSCSFDTELMEEMGTALGKSCQAEDISVLLGPAMNIKRSPLCGRNFEYVSEDPYLSGKMSAGYIKGVQSQNVGTSVKHFAANNQEYKRMSCSSEIDERTLREIYLAGFEIAVKEAKPWSIMASYNKINGTYATENKYLLTDILRDEWGFDGYVVSDWGAVANRVEGIKAGLDLEMPSSNGVTDEQIVEAVKNGALDESDLDKRVEAILNIIFKYTDNRKTEVWDKQKDHELARKIAGESIVLLKNEEDILPLKKGGKYAFIGEFAMKPRFQGGGSSNINTKTVSDALSSAVNYADISYAQGYKTDSIEIDEALLSEAVKKATECDTAVLFVGLPDSFESEGYDREHMELPYNQTVLINKVTSVQPNTVIVLHNGSPVTMPWIDSVKGILELYLGGEAVGEACCDILFGDVNPSGKLAETFPLKLSDTPAYLNFPGDGKKVYYNEGVFVGYRYYDKKETDVLFPFGYGLSYTSFEYKNMKLDKKEINDRDTITVSVDITNTGKMAGKEIVQIYVSDKTNTAMRPVKELKGFTKVSLMPGETKTVSVSLSPRAFEYYNTDLNDWYAATGEYEIMIGKSSREIVLSDTVLRTTDKIIPIYVDGDTTLGELLYHPDETVRSLANELATPMLNTFTAGNDTGCMNEKMIQEQINGNPIHAIKSFAEVSDEYLNSYIDKLNNALGNKTK